MKQTPAHELANGDLLALIPPNTHRVVEPGCSAGALAREYRARHPACEYIGIEIDPEYAELARRHCSRVVVANLEQMGDAELDALAAADCWVFGDVLEHLVDPWTVLARIKPRLAAGGSVVACIPNMQHWSVLARLASGQLFYEDKGLLDRTHLRWFTRTTIVPLFEGAGFRITLLNGRMFEVPNAAAAIAAVRSLAVTLGVERARAIEDTGVLQWLVRAEPIAS